MNKNNKVERVKMHVRTGDHVIVIAGSEKGKIGDITKVLNSIFLHCWFKFAPRLIENMEQYGWKV